MGWFFGDSIFSHKTVIENVMEGPLIVRKNNKGETSKKRKSLAMVGLADKAEHYPSFLSAVSNSVSPLQGRLAMIPEVILFDEPNSALDP